LGYTINGARQLGMDETLGSIKVGKTADPVVLDGNLFEARGDEIGRIKPTAVMMEGVVIHGVLP